MPNYAVTTRWTSGAYGWTEQWYLSTADLDEAAIRTLNICTARLNMCGGLPLIEVWQRVISRVDDPGERRDVNFPLSNPKSPWFENDVDRIWTGALLTIRSNAGRTRTFCARGIADVVTERQWNLKLGDPKYVAAVKTLSNTLVASQALLRRLDTTTAPRVPIAAMSIGPAHGWVRVTRVGHGLLTGDLIRWHRVQASPSCFRGQVRVTRISNDVFEIRNVNLSTLRFVRGSYSRVVYAYDPITEVTLGRTTERPTGGAKNHTRGRAAACRK